MGYRSEVSFTFVLTDVNKFVSLLKLKKTSEEYDLMTHFLEHMYIEKIDDVEYLHFHVEDWKWYSDCEALYLNLIEMGRDFDENFSASFARIGEDTDDIETSTWGADPPDGPYVQVHMELNFNKDKLEPIETKEEVA